MKALTIHAPWAWAITHGGKDIENRTWATSYRGPLAIHAGLSTASNREVSALLAGLGITPPREWVRGAVVAVADLVEVVAMEAVDDLGGTIWAEGPVCWVLRNVRPLATPVPCKGAQGLWTVPVEVERLIEENARQGEAQAFVEDIFGMLF